MTNDDRSKLRKDFESLYLNEKLSDVSLVVNGERIYSHKVILAARCDYFQNLFYGEFKEEKQREVLITETTTVDAFKMLLKYIYTEEISVLSLGVELSLEVFILSKKYLMNDLQSVIFEQLNENKTLESACLILNAAVAFDFEELTEPCLEMLDLKASEFLEISNLADLTQESFVTVLKRDTFYAPEVEIFNAVLRWREKNEDVDDRLLKCVRLALCSSYDLALMSEQSGIIKSDDIVEALAEMHDIKPMKASYRGRKVLDENIASMKNGTKVISDEKSQLLNNRQNVYGTPYYERQIIGPDRAIIIKLNVPHFINYISMLLHHECNYSYCYYIEVSANNKKWKRVIDHSTYKCRSSQLLYFEDEVVQYIKIVATSSRSNQMAFANFEASYQPKIPCLVHGIVRPIKNVALSSLGAKVLQGTTNRLSLLSEEKSQQDYTYHSIVGGAAIKVQLNQPYCVSDMWVKPWSFDNTNYRYHIETSVNDEDWELIDNKDSQQDSEVVTFAPRIIVFIRIVGTFTSANDGIFQLYELKCPVDYKE